MPALKLDDWALPDINPTYTGTWSLVKTGPRSGYALLLTGGTFTLNTRSNHFDIWMIGGGGGGAAGDSYSAGGGGGGGGYVNQLKGQVVNAGSMSVSIGSGGTGAAQSQNNGSNGGATSVSGILSLSAGGGSKAPWVNVYQKNNPGGAGGSGGGGGSGTYEVTRYVGGRGGYNGTAGAQGRYDASSYTAGGGGSGVNMTIFQEDGWYTATPYGSGGQGGCYFDDYQSQTTNTRAQRRPWAGCQGTPNGTVANYGIDADPNHGCGGGGSNRATATKGGSGVVIVRWSD